MPTLAALLGHSKLDMVMRYARPQEHQADAMNRLEMFNAAKEIAEVEKPKDRQNAAVSETVGTISGTAVENPDNYEGVYRVARLL
jgi:hypothetical protein